MENSTRGFLSENSEYLPMMYMDDAIKATIGIIQAPSEQIKFVRLIDLAMSFTPKQIREEIKTLSKFQN